MTTTLPTRPPGSVRFGRRSSRGLLLGLSPLAAAASLIAVLVPVFLLVFAGLAPALWVAVLLGGPLAAAVLIKHDGVRYVDWLPVTVHFVARQVIRQSGYRTRWQAQPVASLALPGEAARLRWMTASDGSVVVHDPWTGGYVAVVRVRAEAFLLLTDTVQDDQVVGLGRLYAGLCQGNVISRIQILESCVPDSGDAMADWWSRRGRPLTAMAGDNYTELLRDAGPASSRNETLIAICLDTRRARAAIRSQTGTAHQRAIKVLDAQRTMLATALATASLPVAGWLTPEELAYEIRTAYDPAARPALDYAPTVGRDLDTAGPLAVDEHWDYLRSDTGFHSVLWIREWPRSDVFPTFLRPLILTPGINRKLSILAAPRTTAQALSEIRKDETALLSEEQIKTRRGQILSLAQRAEFDEVHEREAHITAGHGDMAYAGTITVTAGDLDALIAAVSMVRQAAIQAGCEARVLGGQQMAAFTAAALPLTRGF